MDRERRRRSNATRTKCTVLDEEKPKEAKKGREQEGSFAELID
jgi:hypothetical protein